jgi:hypothetical protein
MSYEGENKIDVAMRKHKKMKPLERPKNRWEKILKQIGVDLKFDFVTLKTFSRSFHEYISVAYTFFVCTFQPQICKNLLMKNTSCYVRTCITKLQFFSPHNNESSFL